MPEGFLFKKELKEVRKFLLSKANLELVVSLPQGVFQPYTGVKTDILYFTNAHKPEAQEGYYYFEVKKDGYTLDRHRRKIEGANDIHKLEASNVRKSEKELLKAQGFEFISFEKIKNNNYSLVGNVYRELSRSTGNSAHHSVSLFSLLDTLEIGSRPTGGIAGMQEGAISLGGEHIGSDGKVNLEKIRFVPLEFYNQAKKGFVKKDDILVCKDGALTGKVCYVDINFPILEVMINEHVYIIRANTTLVLQKYLFFCLKSDFVQSQIKNLAYNKSAQPGLNNQHIALIQIPLPSLEEQQKIVDELDSYQKIIDGAKQIVKNWKPYFETSNTWDIVKIKDICGSNAQYGISEEMNEDNYGYPILRMGNLQNGLIDFSNMKHVKISESDFSQFKLNKGDILFNRTNSFKLVGKTSIFESDINCCFASYLIRIIIDKTKAIPDFINFFMNSYLFQINIKNHAKQSNNQANINAQILLEQPVILPPLYIQQEIVDRLETERKIIESQKETISVFQSKIDSKLNSIWQSEEENEL